MSTTKALCVAIVAPVAFMSTAWAAPNQEVVPPNEASDIATLVATIEGAVNGAYALGVRPAMRDAHAKGHGCVKAEFSVEPDIARKLKVAVFSEARTYKAWIRFSNGAGTPHDDHGGDGRGMAIKLMGVTGKKLLPDEINAETQDFVMINYPVFFIRNVADYVPFTKLSLQGNSDQFFAMHAHEKSIVDAITAKTVDQMFEQRYFSMSPYLLGENYIKFSARPVDCVTKAALVESTAAAPSDPNYLRDAMIGWLSEKDACFRFGVQLQTDPASQPIEDPTILWDEAKAPFVDVASIRIPKQTFASSAQQSFCENLSFTPWHALPQHQPVGGINRLRRAVYEGISQLRHRLNLAARTEPAGDETFP